MSLGLYAQLGPLVKGKLHAAERPTFRKERERWGTHILVATIERRS